MLKWKTTPIQITVAGSEVTADVLGFQAGRNRTIKYIGGKQLANLWVVAYKTAEQVVEIDSLLQTSAAPLIPVDVKLQEGDIFKIGFRDKGAGVGTYNIAIGYEET